MRKRINAVVDYVYFFQAHPYRFSLGKKNAHYHAQAVCVLTLWFTLMGVIELISWGRATPNCYIIVAVILYFVPSRTYTEERLLEVEEKYSTISKGAKVLGIVVVWGWFALSMVLMFLCVHLIAQSKLQ